MGMLFLGTLVSCDIFGQPTKPTENSKSSSKSFSEKESSSSSSYDPVSVLISEGYKYNDEYDWYEKITEDKNDSKVKSYTAIFDLTTSENRKVTYEISASFSTVSFVGDSSRSYYGSIVALERSSDLIIEMHNFNYAGIDGISSKPAIDASLVSSEYKVTTSIYGNIKGEGGNGEKGSDGYSYNINSNNSSSSYARDGGRGNNGGNGAPMILGNNLVLIINKGSKVSIHGGDGGRGGIGGDGEGGSSSGIGYSGDGGYGGNGGSGAYAIKATEDLSIQNNGSLNIIGGNGGDGGDGGDGGNNLDDGTFDRAEHGGDAGDGGRGGDGNYAICIESGHEITLKGNIITLYGGNGGDGGDGGNGGNSCKNAFQSSNGGNPGDAGSGGDGGNGEIGYVSEVINSKIINLPGIGGKGGSHGNPGYNKAIGYGFSGVDGRDGITPSKDEDDDQSIL